MNGNGMAALMVLLLLSGIDEGKGGNGVIDKKCVDLLNSATKAWSEAILSTPNQDQDMASLIDDYRSVIHECPDFSEAQIELAMALLWQGSYKEARQLLEGVIVSEPDNKRAVRFLANVQYKMGDFRAAEASYRDILKRGFDERVDRELYAFTLHNLGKSVPSELFEKDRSADGKRDQFTKKYHEYLTVLDKYGKKALIELNNKNPEGARRLLLEARSLQPPSEMSAEDIAELAKYRSWQEDLLKSLTNANAK